MEIHFIAEWSDGIPIQSGMRGISHCDRSHSFPVGVSVLCPDTTASDMSSVGWNAAPMAAAAGEDDSSEE